MPPILTLTISLTFSILLILRDIKIHKELSYKIWIPNIWVMILASKFVSQWLNIRNPAESFDSILEGSPIDRIVFSILIFLGIIILLDRSKKCSFILRDNVPLMIFFIYSGISITWSDYPVVGFKRWIKEIGNLIMILIIVTEKKPIEALKAVIRRTGYLMIPLSIIFIKYFPQIGRSFSPWTGEPYNIGVTGSKNMLGTLCMVTGIYYFWEFIEFWKNRINDGNKIEAKINFIFLFMVIYLFWDLDSITPTISILIGVLILLFMEIGFIRNNIKNVGLILIIFLLIYWFLDNFFNISEKIIIALGRDVTLTDRKLIWKDLLALKTNPVIGTGYGTFMLGERMEQILSKWRTIVTHSGYLEVYLNLGWIGIIIVSIILFDYYKKYLMTSELIYNFKKFKLSFLIILLIYNYAEKGITGTSFVWFIFLLIYIIR